MQRLFCCCIGKKIIICLGVDKQRTSEKFVATVFSKERQSKKPCSPNELKGISPNTTRLVEHS